jgi:hypothetical protein
VTGVEIVRDLLLFAHLLGMASLVGGSLVQMRGRDRVVNPAMFHGAITQVASGVLLVGTAYALDDGTDGADVDNAKIAVKSVVALVVLGLCWVNRKKTTASEAVFFGVLGLSLLNVAVAVFWQ